MAGTENRWIATSSTDWSVGANWSRGAPPVDDDDVIVGADVADILSGFPDNDAAPAVNSFHRHKNSTSAIGTSASPMCLATVVAPDPVNPFDPTGKVIVEGLSSFYYINGSGGGGGQTTDLLYVDAASSATIAEVDGAINSLLLLKGRITGLTNLGVGTINIGSRENPATDVHFTRETTLSTVRILQYGGTVINTGSAWTAALYISGGTFEHGANAGNLAEILQGGGSVTHNAQENVSKAYILAGILDMSLDPREKTISTLWVFPGAVFKPNAHITITEGGSVFPITPIAPGAGF